MTAAASARRTARGARGRIERGPGWFPRIVLSLLPAAVLILGMRAVGGATELPLSSTQRNLLFVIAALPLATTVFVVGGLRRARGWDPILTGAVWTLCALSVVVMARVAPALLSKQLLWIVLGWLSMLAVIVVPDALEWLRRYKYTFLFAGLALTAITLVVGRDLNNSGIRLWLQIGPLTLQPSELLRVLLIAFLAAYLEERRELLSSYSMRAGGMRLPPLPYLLPLLAMVGVTLLILVFMSDLGPALLYFGTFIAMVYIATGRRSYLLLGVLLFAVAGIVAYTSSGHVHDRIEIWLDPWQDAQGAGFQSLQAMAGFAFGGVGGAGPGTGYPSLIPAAHTDYPLAVVGEEWGLLGTLAVVMLYALLAVRALDLSARLAGDRFGQLLGAGIGVSLGLQSLIVLGGGLRLIPLAGITSPFLSYGGSSMLMSWVLLGLLVRVASGEGGDDEVRAR